jgi:glycosyltransferase involved in cell wall biosynthesis
VREAYLVVPDGIDDPARPSGGNTYDLHLCHELASHGWSARAQAVAGFRDTPDATSFATLEATLLQIPDDALVLLDGLIASTAPEVLLPQARRLHLVVLVHMPLGHRPADADAAPRERAVLEAATATVTTSAWSRRRLIELYGLPTDRVWVAEPGAPIAGPAPGTAAGGALLCVGAVTYEKGHDVLLDALESIAAHSWHCTCVGSLDRDPTFARSLRRRLDPELRERVTFTGPRTGAELDRAYACADLLVHASRAETYGLVVTEALARGLPVIAADVGGLPEALGTARDGTLPGALVGPEDTVALGEALGAWLGDAELRGRLRRAALERRESLPRWSDTAAAVAQVMAEASR